MILITGGTGLVGSHLLYFLLKEHTSIRAIYRKSSDRQVVKKVFGYYTENALQLYNNIQWIEADLTDIPALSEAFKDITHVYHAAAYISFNPQKYYKLKKINIEGTANIVNLCIANQVKKLCYVSSIATLGKTLDHSPITEETPWDPEENNTDYSITKFGAEMEVWRGTQEGLNCVIVNPSIILGEGFWDSGGGVLLTKGIQGTSYYTEGSNGVVDVQDVVRAMLLLMSTPVKNQGYIISGTNITYKQLLTQIATIAGVAPPQKSISKRMLHFLALGDWMSHTILRTKRRLFKPIINAMFKTTTYDTSKIEKDLDFSFTPLTETLERIIKNHKKEK